VLLFRDVLMRILYQLPSFVSRSQYGKRDVCHGKKERQDPSREDVPKDASDNTSDQGGNQLPQSNPQKAERMTREEGRRAESLALQKISSEYRCEIMRESCVRGTSYVFDGIMKDNGLIYGVEVKCGYNRESIQHTLRRFSELYVSLPIIAQETFTPILCVVAKQPNERWKDELMDIVSRSEVRVILRMYSLDDLLNK